jgi:pyruvate dehydrogenase E1 component beta subunit
MRPIVEIMTVNFSLLALDQILNNAATLLHMSGGQVSVPVVIRMTTGAGRQLAAQHSHSLEGWYAGIPGIRVLSPGTLQDARYMLAPALADPDPVVIFEHGSLYNATGPAVPPPADYDIVSAVVRRAGKDVSLISQAGACPRRSPPPTPSPTTGSRPRSSICEACDPWTARPSPVRCPARTARWSSTRGGGPAACPRR